MFARAGPPTDVTTSSGIVELLTDDGERPAPSCPSLFEPAHQTAPFGSMAHAR